nr:hypothetical protein [Tanacetum cinerariifolium]
MDEDLFSYEVGILKLANIPRNLKEEYDLKQRMTHGSNDGLESDPSNARGDDEVKLTNEETYDSDDNDEVSIIFWIETNMFDFDTHSCKAFKEFNFLLQIDLDVLTKYIDGIKTYDEYKDDWIYEWNKDVPWNGQVVAGEKMDIVIEETCMELTYFETRSIIKTLNGLKP